MDIIKITQDLKKKGHKKAVVMDYLLMKCGQAGQVWTPQMHYQFEDAWALRVEPGCPLPTRFTTPAQVIKWVAAQKVALFNQLTDRRVSTQKIAELLKSNTKMVVSTQRKMKEQTKPFGYLVPVKPKGWEFTKQKPSADHLKLENPPKTKSPLDKVIRIPKGR